MLLRYGGIYLDLDVITLTSVDAINYPNYVCAQVSNLTAHDSLNNAVMKLSNEDGKKLAEMFIE